MRKAAPAARLLAALAVAFIPGLASAQSVVLSAEAAAAVSVSAVAPAALAGAGGLVALSAPASPTLAAPLAGAPRPALLAAPAAAVGIPATASAAAADAPAAPAVPTADAAPAPAEISAAANAEPSGSQAPPLASRASGPGASLERARAALENAAADTEPWRRPAAELSDTEIVRALAAMPAERPSVYPDTGALVRILAVGRGELPALAREMFSRPRSFSAVLYEMYLAIHGVVRGSGAAAEPAPLASALSERYADFLDAVRKTPGLPLQIHLVAGRVRHRLLLSGALLEDLFRARIASSRLARLNSLIASSPIAPRIESAARRSPAAVPDWKIPTAPKTPSKKKTAARESLQDLREYSARLERDSDLLELALRRDRIVSSDPRFSAAFRRKLRRQLRDRLDYSVRIGEWTEHALLQYATNRLTNQFIAPPSTLPAPVKPLHVPTNPNLTLLLGESEVVLRARLTTDIPDARVQRFIQESIESYWKGEIPTAQGALPFRTEVEIRVLRPEETFAADDLRVSETTASSPHGNALGFTLTRSGLRYSTPAHEFGHVLGLRDEYVMRYDVRARRFTELQPRDSLMSDGGRVRTADLVRVMQLLSAGGRAEREASPVP
jgi:hypothetical protein